MKIIEDALKSGILNYNGILYHVRGWDKEEAFLPYQPHGSPYGPAWIFKVDLVEWNETPAKYVSSRRKSPKSFLDSLLEGEVDLG